MQYYNTEGLMANSNERIETYTDDMRDNWCGPPRYEKEGNETPEHYLAASVESRPLLALFGFSGDELEGDLFNALYNPKHAWLVSNAYLFNVAKYLWRAGKKGSAVDDYKKAIRYIDEWQTYRMQTLLFVFDGELDVDELKSAIEALIDDYEN